MPDFNQSTRGLAIARAAEAMLRALGAGELRLRLPVMSASAGANRELGLAAPPTEDLALTPALVRAPSSPAAPGRRRLEVLLTPSALAPHLATRGQTAEDFFAAALGVLDPAAPPPVPGAEDKTKLLHIEGVATESFAGTAYLYRIRLAE
jgi:hypothetical protein